MFGVQAGVGLEVGHVARAREAAAQHLSVASSTQNLGQPTHKFQAIRVVAVSDLVLNR